MALKDEEPIDAAEEDPVDEIEEDEDEDEEEVEDPKIAVNEACASGRCSSLKSILDDCTSRVNGKSKTSETCVQELNDLLLCVDNCSATKLWAQLK